MNKLIILTIAIAVMFLMIGTATADDTFTIKVRCKHIEGASGYSSPIFLISTTEGNGYYKEITADYLVSPNDYYHIKIGDTVKLRVSNQGFCEVIEKSDDSWW